MNEIKRIKKERYDFNSIVEKKSALQQCRLCNNG